MFEEIEKFMYIFLLFIINKFYREDSHSTCVHMTVSSAILIIKKIRNVVKSNVRSMIKWPTKLLITFAGRFRQLLLSL